MALHPLWYRWLCLLPFLFYSWLLLGLPQKPLSDFLRFSLSLALGSALLVCTTILFGKGTHQLPSALLLGSSATALGSIVLVWQVPSCLRGQGWKLEWSPSLIPLWLIALKYHYGADVFGAVMSYVTGLPAYLAIDITQSFGWFLTMLMLYGFCREAGLNRGFSGMAALWVMLGAGWAYLLQPWLASHTLDAKNLIWPHSYIIFSRHLNPGTVSNFFMTPYSLGLPLFFAYLTLWTRWTRSREMIYLVLAAFLCGALAIIQVTFFISLLFISGVLLVVEKVWGQKNWKTLAIQIGVLTGISVPLALALGGFLASSQGYSPHSLIFHWPPGYLKNATWWARIPITPSQGFLWYLATFGSLVFLALPCFFFALRSALKKRNSVLWFLTLYAAQCFVIPQFFQYRLTLDIIKWFTGFQITAVLVIVFLFSESRKKFLLAIFLVPLMMMDLVAPTRFLYDLAFLSAKDMPEDHRRWWYKTPQLRPPSPDLQRVLSLLRQYPWSEVVFSPYFTAAPIAWYGGQSVSEIDPNTGYFGVKPEIMQERRALTASLAKEFQWERMAMSPIRWIAFSCSDYEKTFTDVSKESIALAVQSGQMQDLSFTMGPACWKLFHANYRR
ncbi:MAG: hypothetical protein K8R69_01220 [Deltaproteobacteria bacterium]|nr:hypothetical protein [Deltaproteobacteria bacterium]